MKPKQPVKDNTFLYIASTLAFILLGIILTAVINNTNNSSQDIRSKASATSGVEGTAVITTIDSETNTIIVDNLAFKSSPDKNLGSWTVTAPTAFNYSSIIVGNTITVIIDPLEFDILNHTFSAKKIQKK